MRGPISPTTGPYLATFPRFRRNFPRCPRPQDPYSMRNPHPCYLQSFSSKLQGQPYLPCLNAQCPSPVDYNEGALGVQSPAPLNLESDPPTFLKASLQYGQPTDQVSASAPNSKADIEGPQYAQSLQVDYLRKLLPRCPPLGLWISSTRRSFYMKLCQSGLHMTRMHQLTFGQNPSPP